MIFLLFFVFTFISCYQSRTHNSECADWEVSCDNGECISKLQSCNSIEDCSDGSDEGTGCNGENSTPYEARAPNGKLLPKVNQHTIEAVRKAAKYIVNQVTDDGWGDFTPRAVVALSFANVVSAITYADKELMMKYLKMHLMRDLLEMTFRRINPSLVSLASYINALYATCQDPRSVQGYDLVALLRSEVDKVISSNFSYPYVLMSLCIADAIKGNDANRLEDMYSRSSNPGSKALEIIAMACIGRKDEDINKRVTKLHLKHFFENSEPAENMDIYSKALYLQAAIASNFSNPSKIARYQLESYQLSDGSFGHMLATYSLIPVLLYSSLLDLRCKLPAKRALVTTKEFEQSAVHEVVYSLWIPTKQVVDTHSMTVPFFKNANFFDIMRTAAVRNPLFKFLYEETPSGKKVYSLAGIPNDIETSLRWTLYEGHPNVTIDSRKYLKEITLGIDKIFPKDKDHLSFVLNR